MAGVWWQCWCIGPPGKRVSKKSGARLGERWVLRHAVPCMHSQRQQACIRIARHAHVQSAAAGMHTTRVIDAGDTTVHLPATAALKELWQVELGRVRSLSEGGEGFTAVHYAAAALQLLDSQQAYNTVGLEDMEELLGRYVEGTASMQTEQVRAGAAVLRRLVQANALSVRPPSDWARDIPEEAFSNGDPLVTVPSTMDLYCMRRIRPQLEKVLEEHDSAQ